MPEETATKITIQNKLMAEKRDLNIYHHSTRSAYMISRNNSVGIDLDSRENGDYIHISIVSGPGGMEKDCWLNIPAWCFFSFSGMCNGDIFHVNQRFLVRIPPGPPVWQLKISKPAAAHTGETGDSIFIGDFEHIPGEGLVQ
jgi:hypothetical protein